jgi:protein ImuB
VTVSPNAGREVVSSACALAERCGIVGGMTLAHARALVPAEHLRVSPLDRRADAEALDRLAAWLYRRLPRVMSVPSLPGVLGEGAAVVFADISGCQRLFRSEARMVRALSRALRRAGITSRLATAPTYGAAWALARHGSEPQMVAGDDTFLDELRPLTVAALPLDDDTCVALEDLGVESIGQLEALPRASLPSRFGDEVLLRLDQAYGQAIETITPIQLEPPVKVHRAFAGPVKNAEAISRAGQLLLNSFCKALKQRESGMYRLRLDVERYDADDLSVFLRVGRASRDVGHLWRLLSPKLETLNLGYGVESLTLTASHTTRIAHTQLGPRRPGVDQDRDVGELLDVLDARLGPSQVGRLSVRETHEPRRVFGLQDAATGPVAQDDVALTPQERPSRLLHPPRRIDVVAVTPDGPVVQLKWEGQEHDVTRCLGPERLCGQWWRGDPSEDDYYRVRLDDGRWLWVCRTHDPEAERGWFVRGLWA